MQISIAIALLEKGPDPSISHQTWADLGAGNGLFTRALRTILGDKSTIYAIDKNAEALEMMKQISESGIILY